MESFGDVSNMLVAANLHWIVRIIRDLMASNKLLSRIGKHEALSILN